MKKNETHHGAFDGFNTLTLSLQLSLSLVASALGLGLSVMFPKKIGREIQWGSDV